MAQDPQPLTFPQVLANLEQNDVGREEARIKQERAAREELQRKRDMALHQQRTRSQRHVISSPEGSSPPPELLAPGADALKTEQERQRHEQAISQGFFPPPPTGPT